MAYIRTLSNGNFRADVRMKGINKNKTFPSQSFAQAWADRIENSINRSYALTAGEKSGFKYSFPKLNSEINAAMTFLNNSCRIW